MEEVKKVYKYVPLEDIYDYGTTLELSYYDYEHANLVAIYKNGHILYYLEVFIPEDEEYYGTEKAYNFI